MSTEISHKKTGNNGSFFIRKEKGIASELTYIMKDDDIMVVNHTETKPLYEGQGLGSMLVEEVVAYARKNSYKIEPLCPFVEVKFDNNTAYNDVRA